MKKFLTIVVLALFAACNVAHADWLGDFAPATTAICGQYTTYNPSTGAPFTLAGTPALAVYKIGDGVNSTTESTTGVTHAEDVDARTGMNRVCIDTSADGTFYSAGAQFSVVITAGTVNSVSVVGSEVKSFSLNKVSALRPATAGRTLVVDAAGLADATAVKLGPTGAATAQTARDIGASVLLSSGTGTGQLSITSGVVNGNNVQQAGASLTTCTGAIPTLGIIDCGTAQAVTSTTLQLRSAATFADSEIVGATCLITGGTTGVGQSRTVKANVGSTDTVTVDAWTTTPTGTITYACIGTAPGASGIQASDVWTYATRNLTSATNITSTGVAIPITASRVDASVGAYQTSLAPLQPTVAGRTLDVSVTGEAGMDWANIGAPTTAVNLSGTTFSTSQAVASVSGAVGSVTGAVGSVTGNVGGNVTGSVGSVVGAVGSVTGAVGSVTGNVGGNVTGSVGSVTGNVGGTVNGLTTTAQGNVRTAVGLATANLDTQIATLATASALSTVGTNVSAVKTVTDKLDSGLQLNGAGPAYQFTSGALAQAPTGGGAGFTANQVTAINTILGVPGSGTTPIAPTAGALFTLQGDTDDIQTRLPSALVSGRMDSTVGAYQTGSVPLQPTVAGRTLDVSVTGEAGIDWANVGSPTTAVNLSGTTFSTGQTIAAVTGAVGSVTGNLNGNVVGSVGSVSGAVGSVTGAVGSVTGAVGSVTGNVGGTVNGLTTTAQGNVRTAVGLAAANLDTQFASVATGSALSTVGTNVSAVKTVTDKLDSGLQLNGAGPSYQYTSGALAQAPTGGGAGFTANQVTAISTILGVPGSGTTPITPVAGVLSDIDALSLSIQADTDNIQTRLPTALVSGRIDSSVGAMATNTVNANAVASDAVTELQAGLATSSAVGVVGANVNDLQARVPAALVGGKMDSSITALGANVITAATIATDAVTKLQNGLSTMTPTEVRDLIVEDQGGGISLGCALAAIVAYGGGDLTTTNGAGTYKDPSGTENRITFTVTSAGNRNASITCPSY